MDPRDPFPFSDVIHAMRIGTLMLCVALGGAMLSGLTASSVACNTNVGIHDTEEGKNNDCITCHASAYSAAANPKHTGILEDTCTDCHTTMNWTVPKLHELEAVKATTCVKCHQAEYDATKQPKHEPNFPTDCKDCHSTEDYKPLYRDIHESETVKKPKPCFDCHEEQYKAAQNPKHEGVFPTTCEGCHNTKAWKPSGTTPPPATDGG